jgi:hypothetical protein
MLELLYYGYNQSVNPMMTGIEPVESRKDVS